MICRRWFVDKVEKVIKMSFHDELKGEWNMHSADD